MVQHQFESVSPRHGNVTVVVDFDENKRNLKLQLISKDTDQTVFEDTFRSVGGVEGFLFGRNIETPDDFIECLQENVEEATMFGLPERRVVFHDQCLH